MVGLVFGTQLLNFCSVDECSTSATRPLVPQARIGGQSASALGRLDYRPQVAGSSAAMNDISPTQWLIPDPRGTLS